MAELPFDSLPKDILKMILLQLDLSSLLRLRLVSKRLLQPWVEDWIFGRFLPPYQLSRDELDRGLAALRNRPALLALRRRTPTEITGSNKQLALGHAGLGIRLRDARKVAWRPVVGLETPPPGRFSKKNLFESMHIVDARTSLFCGYDVVVRAASAAAAAAAAAGSTEAPGWTYRRVPLDKDSTSYASSSLLLEDGLLLVGTQLNAFLLYRWDTELTVVTNWTSSHFSGLRSLRRATKSTCMSIFSNGVEQWDIEKRVSLTTRATFKGNGVLLTERLSDCAALDQGGHLYALSGAKHLLLVDLRLPNAVCGVLNDDGARNHHSYSIWTLQHDPRTGCLFSSGGDSLVCLWDLRGPRAHLQTVDACTRVPTKSSHTERQFVLRLQLDGSSLFNVTAGGIFSCMRWNAAAKTVKAAVSSMVGMEDCTSMVARGDVAFVAASCGVFEMKIA